jgi:glycosyltransferase involved in cell wall biosynthesis
MGLTESHLVSVVIPSFNHAHLIGRAINSVIDQTYRNWEIIVVDNHSVDNTFEIVNSFQQENIHFHRIHNNGVIAASRNLGIQLARGDWVAFLDSDDVWYQNKLEVVINTLNSETVCDVYCHNELKAIEKTAESFELVYGPYEEDFYKKLLLHGNRLSTSATVVNRQYLLDHELRFNEKIEFITVEDYALWLDLARSGAKFVFIDDVLGEYFIHEDNSSSGVIRHWKNTQNLLHHHIYNIQDFSDVPDELWEGIYTRLCLSRLKQAISIGELGIAFKAGFEICLKHPVRVFCYIFQKLRINDTF